MQASVSTKQATGDATESLAGSLTSLMKHLMMTTGREFFAEMEKTGVSLTQAKSLMIGGEVSVAIRTGTPSRAPSR